VQFHFSCSCQYSLCDTRRWVNISVDIIASEDLNLQLYDVRCGANSEEMGDVFIGDRLFESGTSRRHFIVITLHQMVDTQNPHANGVLEVTDGSCIL
jgi:hypothetical protein